MLFARVLSAVAALALTGSSPVAFTGSYALERGTPQTQGHLVVTELRTAPLEARLDLWLTRGTATVTRYDIDMTKYLHLIAIGDDFTTFLHVHPLLGADHHFHLDVRFPKPGLYHIYADSDPTGIGQQVFRYDVPLGAASMGARDVAPTGTVVRTGPYSVSLATTSLHAGSESEIPVHIREGGKPARDLHPYLGALAHAVFIDAHDLSYAHVHPMALDAAGKTDSMSGMSGMSGMAGMSGMSGMSMPGMNAPPLADSATSSPDMLLHVRVFEPGTYKLWLQFRASDGLHVAPFVLVAS